MSCVTFQTNTPVRRTCTPRTEWLEREERGETVPVHGLARPRRAGVPDPYPGIPTAGKDVQSPRRRPHGGPLQVSVHKRRGGKALGVLDFNKNLMCIRISTQYLVFVPTHRTWPQGKACVSHRSIILYRMSSGELKSFSGCVSNHRLRA